MTDSISLRSGLASELRGSKYLRESLKLTLRARLHQRQTDKWIALLNSHPLFADMLPACPRLVNKLYRNYLSTTLDCQDRLDALSAHYRFVIGQGLATLVARAAHAPVELCALDGREAGQYSVQLRAGGVLVREGELILQLMQGEQHLYSLAFSFVPGAGGLAIFIGCLQGPSDELGRERIRLATRALHGMRPKFLLLALVRQLGFDFGCRELTLVGNSNRVVTGATRAGRVHADYDSAWEELKAWRRPDGDYGLACSALPELRLDDIASKKRSEARKRHAMLEAAVSSLNAVFHKAPGALRAPAANDARIQKIAHIGLA